MTTTQIISIVLDVLIIVGIVIDFILTDKRIKVVGNGLIDITTDTIEVLKSHKKGLENLVRVADAQKEEIAELQKRIAELEKANNNN
jgi:hypothetical protein